MFYLPPQQQFGYRLTWLRRDLDGRPIRCICLGASHCGKGVASVWGADMLEGGSKLLYVVKGGSRSRVKWLRRQALCVVERRLVVVEKIYVFQVWRGCFPRRLQRL